MLCFSNYGMTSRITTELTSRTTSKITCFWSCFWTYYFIFVGAVFVVIFVFALLGMFWDLLLELFLELFLLLSFVNLLEFVLFCIKTNRHKTPQCLVEIGGGGTPDLKKNIYVCVSSMVLLCFGSVVLCCCCYVFLDGFAIMELWIMECGLSIIHIPCRIIQIP